MARTTESLAELSQLVDRASLGGEKYFGTVAKGVRAGRRLVLFQQRNIYDPEQRHTAGWTVQPVPYLEIDGEGLIPLPYGKDVAELKQPLQDKVVNFFKMLAERGRI